MKSWGQQFGPVTEIKIGAEMVEDAKKKEMKKVRIGLLEFQTLA